MLDEQRIMRGKIREFPEKVELEEQLYQSWLIQLQTWAANGRLVSAGADAVRLRPGQATDQLVGIANRLPKIDARNALPIEVLRESAMPGAAKEAELIP